MSNEALCNPTAARSWRARRPRTAPGLLLATTVMLALAGCAPQPTPTDSNFGFTASEEVTAAMADGTVSGDEYEQAFQRYRECLEREGYALLIEDDGSTPAIEYSVPTAAVDSGVDDECYYVEFYQVDTAWQIQSE